MKLLIVGGDTCSQESPEHYKEEVLAELGFEIPIQLSPEHYKPRTKAVRATRGSQGLQSAERASAELALSSHILKHLLSRLKRIIFITHLNASRGPFLKCKLC